MSFSTLKFRFSPSPTGLMHLGNTRTALFNALYSQGVEGTFMLRIEDTDKERSSEAFTTQLLNDLTWLNLLWQEGPGIGGENGPYWQSQRNGIYDAYYQILEEKALAYPCFCSETELAVQRKVQLASGKPPRYAGTCRHLTVADRAKKMLAGEMPTLRFRVPSHQMVEFIDFVKGPQRFNTEDLGDFIIRRADGSASFMYCNAIDDAVMKVTHVMRGEDHLTNTPRQILILQALHLPVPQYGHIALILGHDGSPLSKRHGSRSIHELKEEGFLPLGIINYLARLGHSYDDNHFMSLDVLAQKFNVDKLSRSPARFDAEQLLYWQKTALSNLDNESLWQWMGIAVHSVVPAEKKDAFIDTVRPHLIFPADALYWASLIFDEHLHYDEPHQGILKTVDKLFFQTAIEVIMTQGANYPAILEAIKQKTGLKGKALFQPLRLVLSNQEHGPELSKLVALLGEEMMLNRFRMAMKTG